MPLIGEAMRELVFSYRGSEMLQVPACGHGEWSPEPGEAAFLFVAGIPLAAALQSPCSQLDDRIAGGEYMLVPAGCRCLLRNGSDQNGEALLIRFAVQGAAEALAAIRELDREYLERGHIRSFRMPQGGAWIEDFSRECAPDDYVHRCRLQSHLYMILAGFIEALNKPKAAAADLQTYIGHARDYIAKHCHEVIDIEALAQASGVSSSRFYRAFRRHAGLSPLQYATAMRLQAAMRLLAGSAASVAEAAHAVGYADEHYFSRVFKKQLGLSPSRYVAAARRKVAVLSPVFLGDLDPLGIAPGIAFERQALQRPEETLARLRLAAPDLILCGPVDDGLRAELERIAPTKSIRWKGYPWKRRLLDIAEWLDLAPVAEYWLSLYHAKAENARQRMLAYWAGEPVLLAVARPQDFIVFGGRSRKLNDLFYEEMGLTAPGCLQPLEGPVFCSLRELAGMDCVNLMIMVPSALGELEMARLEQDWRQLGLQDGKKRCLFIPYDGVLNYNASCYDRLVDQSVWRIGSRLTSD